MAAAGQTYVARLVYVADVPSPPGHEPEDATWLDEDPHILVGNDGTVVLDNEWWLNEEAGTTFTSEVLDPLLAEPETPRSQSHRGGPAGRPAREWHPR